MAIKLTAGYPSKIIFKFYDENGDLLTDLSNTSATLYSSLTGEAIEENLSLSYDSDNQYYYLIYTPSSDLSGTYYFVATGDDSEGIKRTSTVFVDILPETSNLLLVDFDKVTKFINDINIDYSVLPSLILVATEWVQDITGKIVLPKTFEEEVKIFNKKVYLSKFPILQINSITDKNGNEITNYSIYNSELGILKVDVVNAAEIRVKTETLLIVNYTAGYNPIPETIYTAIAMIVGYLYDRAKYMNFDRIRMLGVDGILSKDVLDRVKEILMPYIKVV